jgi:hypothetical protein
MESAVPLVMVYQVEPFRTPVVTLMLFWLSASSANRNGVGAHDVVTVIEQQKFLSLVLPWFLDYW